jgi:hypothetical protein
MGRAKAGKRPAGDVQRAQAEWRSRLAALVDQVEAWGREFDWATRRIDKQLNDLDVGTYPVQGLLLQKDFARVLLEPMGRSASGSGGVVDLYLMPAYDDIARLFLHRGKWRFEHEFPGAPPTDHVLDGRCPLLTKEAFRDMLEQMVRHAAQVG